MNRPSRTLKRLLTTKLGRTAGALGAASLVLLITLASGYALSFSASAPTPATTARETSIDTLGGRTSPPPGTPPVIAANGQVDIGGPGIPANADAWIDPTQPEATPDPDTGLAAWPMEVPLNKLTTPMLPGVPVSACASPASSAGRAMGNAIVAYLFTWDASNASFAEWVAPLEREWSRTSGYYGGEGSDGKFGAYTFDDRLEWLELTPQVWEQFNADHAKSEVRVNSVTTMMNGRHNLRLIYTVTVTRSSSDGLSVSKVRDVEIWLTAPCEHDDYAVAAASGEPVWDLTGLQFWDVRGWGTPER